MITAAPMDGSSNELCDWLELAVLATATGRALLTDVNLGLEMEEDFEPDELDEEDGVRERRVQQVLAAMDERREQMGAAYPFSRDDAYLVLADEPSDAGIAYLFCLIVSSAAKSGPLHEDGPWKPDLQPARDLFQVCATVAAAGYVTGPAFSTGWPRPDGSTFLDKLKEAYGRFGDGRPRAIWPAEAPDQAKDDEIDVIAFRQERDGRGGTLYLLAQVASGANWRAKSVRAAIEVFHATWFELQPASTPSPALAIPFWLPSNADVEEGDHEQQTDIEAKHWRTIKEFGVLFHRYRLVEYLDKGQQLPTQGISPVERHSELPDVRAYVRQYRTQLVAAVQALK